MGSGHKFERTKVRIVGKSRTFVQSNFCPPIFLKLYHCFVLFTLLRGTLQKKTVYLKTLSKREGGRSTQFQKNKKNDFLTKGEEGGSHKHFVKNISTLFCRIYYSIWSNQFQTNCGKCPLLFYEGFLYA